MTAQHEVLVEGVRQRLRAVRERALADATSHLDAVSEAGPRRVCERIARCDHRTAAAQQQLEHLITQWQRERAAHAESIAARRRARLEGHYGAQRRFLLFDGRRPPVSDSWNQFAGRRTADALQLGARGRARTAQRWMNRTNQRSRRRATRAAPLCDRHMHATPSPVASAFDARCLRINRSGALSRSCWHRILTRSPSQVGRTASPPRWRRPSSRGFLPRCARPFNPQHDSRCC